MSTRSTHENVHCMPRHADPAFLALAIHFQLSDNYIVEDVHGRRGVLHVRVITWQTFFVVATFCIFLRYVARKVQ